MKPSITWIAALTIVFVALVAVSSVPAQEPTPAGDAAVVVTEPAQVVDAGCSTGCAPKYCITYRKHHTWRKVCCGCCVEPYTTMLTITDPCTCCPVEVPVCVPGCCTDAPSVSCRRGLFGRTITEYTWCCGYSVRIVLDRRNTVTVHTYGS